MVVRIIDALRVCLLELHQLVTKLWENIANLDSALQVILVISATLGAFFSFIQKKRKPQKEFNRYIDQNYGYANRILLNKFYIETRGQDIDPCYNDEIREDNGVFFSVPLVPFFINTAFLSTDQAKYYLVLADSGMGKSTFLLSLYHDYLLQPSRKKRNNIKLIPLSKTNCIETISKLPDKDQTILLLDALDENIDAMNNYGVFFSQLLKATEDFHCIIITCRTQFFPNSDAEPTVTGRIKSGVGNKSESIVKKYISPFTDERVNEYLKKRYRYKRRARRRATEIVYKAPSLMARPIILNWVDFLCDDSDHYAYTFQIYRKIIDKWIEREEIHNTGEKLFALSLEIATYMFRNQSTSIPGSTVDAIAMRDNIDLSPIVAKSRSLLNRNGNGEYKFAHRSFLEYFMAFSVFQEMAFQFNQSFFLESSNARMFLMEMLIAEFMKDSKQVNNMQYILGELVAGKKDAKPVDEAYVHMFLSEEMQIREETNSDSISLGFNLSHLRLLNRIHDSSDFYIEYTRSNKGDVVISIKMVQRTEIDPNGGQYIGEFTRDEIVYLASHLNEFSDDTTAK